MNPNRILVIQTAFIGDVILSTALLESLHKQYNSAKLDIMVRRGNESLFENHPYINKVHVWDKKGGKYQSLFRLLKEIRLIRYDLLINLQRYATTGILTLFSRATVKVGFDKNPLSFSFTHKVLHEFEKGIHEIERNHRLIDNWVTDTVSRPRLYPSQNDYQFVEKFQDQTYICLSPASVWFTKQYTLEGWIQLIKALPDHYKIFITGGKGDAVLANSIIAALEVNQRNRVVNLCGELTFLRSAALMQGAVMNYVNDSAPMHLCSAVNAPVCTIYCSTVPEFGYGPLSEKSFIVETKENLSCRPCGLHGHKACPEKHFRCASGISTGQLTAVLGIT